MNKQQKIEQLEAALAFYAAEDTHLARMEGEISVWPILNDRGMLARQALGIPEPPTFDEKLAGIMANVGAAVE